MVKRIFIFIIILIFLSPHIHLIVNAEDDEYIPQEYESLLESIPDDIADLLPEEIFSRNGDNIIKGAEKLISWQYILDYIFDIIGLNLKPILKSISVIVSILVLSSLLNLLKNSFKNQAINNIITLIGSIVMVSSLMEICREPISKAMTLLEEIQLFVNTMSPTITAMYAMGGNISTAVVQNYGLIVFLSILENICIISLQLIIGVCMALTLASTFVQDINLLSLSNGIKKIFTFVWGFITIAFTTVISAQNLLSSKADSLSSKTAKMLVGHIIPIAGGTVGESLKTAGASIEYLRSSVGVIFIVILILIIVPPIISISLYRLSFIVSNSVAGLLGCKEEGKILLEISSILGYVLAILSICSIVLLFLITIFAKCSSPLN